jgi:hypothetical protein
MSAQGRNDLEAKLKDLEDKSGIQLVVATVKSLEGSDIETYANHSFVTGSSAKPRRTMAYYSLLHQRNTRYASRLAMDSKER